jgi:hypothetical protein
MGAAAQHVRKVPTPLLLAAAWVQVRLLGNNALFGGAVDLTGPSSLTIKGRSNLVHNNTAGIAGGAFYVDPPATLLIQGRLCASGNRATSEGGFAYARGQVVFGADSEVYLSDNTPNSIFLDVDRRGRGAGVARCGQVAPSWNNTQDTAYNITGPACACNTTFVAGDGTTCDSPFPVCDAST